MKSRHYVFVLGLVLIACVSAYILLPAYTDFKDGKREADELQGKLAEIELESREIDHAIQSLRTDPRAIERVAREKLGWCREDEKIYHFDPPPVPAPAQPAE